MNTQVVPTCIVGAGLAGLLAGHAFPNIPIVEASPESSGASHRALLRFRSDAVSKLTGIPFRRVRVRKGIWSRGAYHTPNPRLATLYARKVLDAAIGDRSIWNIDPVDRWVAPEDFPERMVEALHHRITWGCEYDYAGLPHTPAAPIISTAPLSVPLGMAAHLAPTAMPTMRRAPIWVTRFRVPGADTHMTVYFPDHQTAVYRASVTGDVLIIESRAELSGPDEAHDEVDFVLQVLGLPDMSEADLEPLGTVSQRYGKIVPLHDDVRRPLLAMLTMRHGIYSLGRFATWRNVLLDDVVNDIDVIRRMMRNWGGHSASYAMLRAGVPGLAIND